jgi:FkbM family methyltransferase
MATASELLMRGLNHHRVGRFAEAELLYRDILHDWPDDVDALHLFGVLFAQTAQYEVAAGLVRRAVALRPDRGDFHATLGNIFCQQGKLREGGDCYKRAMYLSYLKRLPVGYDEILQRADLASVRAGAAGVIPDIAAYKSESLQDLFLDRWVFRGLEGGVFVDIGAHDGITHSNSWFFEKKRNWRGACVEPHPAVFRRLAANRSCRVFDCCVANGRGPVEFLKIAGYSEMLSGMADRYDAQHKQRIAEELRLHGGSSELIAVQARTFADIAVECSISDVDYLSIDTEGSELDVLQSIDFGRTRIHALTVECNDRNSDALNAMMWSRGYELIKSISPDLLFLYKKSPYYPAYDQLRSA